jgi:hypothetical protein
LNGPKALRKEKLANKRIEGDPHIMISSRHLPKDTGTKPQNNMVQHPRFIIYAGSIVIAVEMGRDKLFECWSMQTAVKGFGVIKPS